MYKGYGMGEYEKGSGMADFLTADDVYDLRTSGSKTGMGQLDFDFQKSITTAIPKLSFTDMLKNTVSGIMAKLPDIGANIAADWANAELRDALNISTGETTKVVRTSAPTQSPPSPVTPYPVMGTQKEIVNIPTTPKWVMPVAIGAGILGIGGLVYIARR